MSSTRYCNIHRLLWNDDKFPYVSDDCQLVTLHTFTTNYMTNFGLAQVSVHALADQKKWGPKGKKKADPARYLRGFREGLSEGFYQYDEFHQMVYVPNMKKYNPPNNPNVLISWGKEYSLFPDCELKVLFYQSYKAFMEGFGEGFREAFGKAFIKALAKPHVYVSVSESVSIELKGESEGAKKPTRINGDMILSDEMRAYALTKGILESDIPNLFEGFINHWVAATKNATSARWDLKWRTWVLNDLKWNGNKRQPISQKIGAAHVSEFKRDKDGKYQF